MQTKLLASLAAGAIGLSVALADPAPSRADWTFQSGNWHGQAYHEEGTGSFTHCAVVASYVSGDILVFSLNRGGDFAIAVSNPAWQLAAGDVYPVNIIIDRYRPVPAQARAISSTQAVASFRDAYGLFQNVRRGRMMWIETGGSALTFDLTGTSRALGKAAECLAYELDQEFAATRHQAGNPFIARAPQSSGASTVVSAGFGQIDRAELMILASNVFAEAGITGHRFLADQEKTGAFQTLDVAWVGPGARAGGLTGFKLDRPEDLPTILATVGGEIAASDARACDGRFASIPAQPGYKDGTYRLELQTACDGSAGAWTFTYSFFGLSNGRLFRFTFIEELDGQASSPAHSAPEVLPATFDAAAARVIRMAR